MKTDLEISKALALAIGWTEEQLRLTHAFGVQVCTDAPVACYTSLPWWRGFDYRDWNVIGPIAEKFDCFPYKNSAHNWVTTLGGRGRAPWPFVAGDTPQEAIALAVIGAKK